MTMTQATLPYLYDQAVAEVSTQIFFEEPFLWPALYKMLPSDGPSEKHASFGGPGLFQEKVEGVAMTEDTLSQQFAKTFVHKAYSLYMSMSREASDDDRFGLMSEIAMMIGQKGAETMESHAAALFLDIFAGATYKAEDSLPISYSAHLNADGGNSQSNTSTTLVLNYANAKTVRKNMRNFTDYDGGVVSCIADEIIAGTQLEEDGWQLVRSAGKPGSSNNDLNFFSGKYTFYVWPWLSSWTTQWAMMASNLRRRMLRWYQRVGLEVVGDAVWQRQIRQLGGYMRYSLGSTDWRWVFASTGGA